MFIDWAFAEEAPLTAAALMRLSAGEIEVDELAAAQAAVKRSSPSHQDQQSVALTPILLRRLRSRGEFISVRIAKIGDEGTVRTLRGRTLDCCATMRRTGLVPR